jgi:Tfp pilus assembly protein PilF
VSETNHDLILDDFYHHLNDMNQSEQNARLFKKAVDFFESGMSKTAQNALIRILEVDPRHSEALHLSGIIADRNGRRDLAANHISAAIRFGPRSPLMHVNLGVILQKQTHFKEAESQFQQALALAPEFEPALERLSEVQSRTCNLNGALASLKRLAKIRPDAKRFHGIGVLYTRMGNLNAAADAYQKALVLESARPDTLNNLGLILKGTGKVDKALDCLEKAVAIDSRYTPALINLGLMYRVKQQPQKAENLFRQAITADPEHAPAHNYLGQVLRLQGHLDASVTAHQNAIRLIMSNPLRPVAPRKTLDVGTAHQVLKETKNMLDRTGISFFLCAGTLLGIVRDGDLLPHDKDMDLGLPWDTDRPKLTAVMTADDRFSLAQLQPGPSGIAPDKDTFLMTFVHNPTRIIVNMFFFKPDGDHFLYGFDQEPFPVLSRPEIFDLTRFAWQGAKWRIPSKPERYLEDMYGPEWRTPDPCFDTVVSSFCMTEESRPVRRCFGYERLFSRLRSGQKDKAAGYCQQLLALQRDPFIAELQKKIGKQAVLNNL